MPRRMVILGLPRMTDRSVEMILIWIWNTWTWFWAFCPERMSPFEFNLPISWISSGRNLFRDQLYHKPFMTKTYKFLTYLWKSRCVILSGKSSIGIEFFVEETIDSPIPDDSDDSKEDSCPAVLSPTESRSLELLPRRLLVDRLWFIG